MNSPKKVGSFSSPFASQQLADKVFYLKATRSADTFTLLKSGAGAPHSTTWPQYLRSIGAGVLECAGVPALSIVSRST